MSVDTASIAEDLNQSCHCIAVDRDALARELERGPLTAGIYERIVADRPHLFSASPVFVAGAHLAHMREVVETITRLAATPAFGDRALAAAPSIAAIDRGARGVCMGFDFHVGATGPQLIEINTNAGGALLNDALLRAGRACCGAVDEVLATIEDGGDPAAATVAMFREEWQRERGDAPLRRIAVVDEDPQQQYLYPEFLMYRELFENAGIACDILDVRELVLEDGRLTSDGRPVDLVYNRTTDFYFAHENSAVLRAAWEAGAAVVTPSPHHYALLADKRHLITLSDPEELAGLGLAAEACDLLTRSVPETRLVTDENREQLWQQRRQWFFKPLGGYGGRATYRGDKVTRKVWNEISKRPYVAQRTVAPSTRNIVVEGREVPLKLDLRCYAYDGRVLRVAARLYDGQTTNFRTAGGGFAPVYSERNPLL
jgi:hypothetical protein